MDKEIITFGNIKTENGSFTAIKIETFQKMWILIAY